MFVPPFSSEEHVLKDWGKKKSKLQTWEPYPYPNVFALFLNTKSQQVQNATKQFLLKNILIVLSTILKNYGLHETPRGTTCNPIRLFICSPNRGEPLIVSLPNGGALRALIEENMRP